MYLKSEALVAEKVDAVNFERCRCIGFVACHDGIQCCQLASFDVLYICRERYGLGDRVK